MTQRARELWSNRSVFILALMGSSIGLGNIWRFPYLVSEQGGGTFVLVYLACVLLLGVPMMIAEALIGRQTRLNPASAMQRLSEESGASRRWLWVGGLSIVTSVLVFSFYAVVAAWIFYYVFALISGQLIDVGLDQATSFFGQILMVTDGLIISHTLFMLVIMLILAAGVRRGLDRAIRYLMPLMLLLLLILLIYATQTGYFAQAYFHLFSLQSAPVSGSMVMAAIGHVFFTFSLGMGVVMTYGSYLSRKESIGQTVACVGVMDTLLAVLVGLVVFPILMSAHMEPDSGPGLLFITMPVALGQMHAGQALTVLFFLFVGVAAVTSAISLMEPMTAWCEQRWNLTRVISAVLSVSFAWVLSLIVLLSFSHFANITLFNMNLFEQVSTLTTYVLLPVVGLCVMIFVGWVLTRRTTQDALSMRLVFYYIWRFCLCFLVPIAVSIIFVVNLYNVPF